MSVLQKTTFTPDLGMGDPVTITVTATVADWIDRVWAKEQALTFRDASNKLHTISRSDYTDVDFGEMFTEGQSSFRRDK